MESEWGVTYLQVDCCVVGLPTIEIQLDMKVEYKAAITTILPKCNFLHSWLSKSITDILSNGCHWWISNCLPFRSILNGVHVVHALVFCVMFCRSLFVCPFAIVVSVLLRITADCRIMLSSNFSFPRFNLCSFCSSFSFLCSILYTIVCLFVPFLLAIILYVLLRITAFGYLFGIFKLFLSPGYSWTELQNMAINSIQAKINLV